MSTSTDGQICYGIMFDEDYEFPWSADDYEDGDISDWWRDVNGYVNPIESPFTDDGDYKPGYHQNDPRIDQYFAGQSAWDKLNPLPIELVNYQSGDYPAYIIAIPSTVKTANRGNPIVFSPGIELVVSGQDRQALIDFCTKYGLEINAPPSWYLSSYWG